MNSVRNGQRTAQIWDIFSHYAQWVKQGNCNTFFKLGMVMLHLQLKSTVVYNKIYFHKYVCQSISQMVNL